jgi:chromosome segregation ATPase
MTTDQITLHLCEVIAEQKEKINQLESAYNYVKGRNDNLIDGIEIKTKEKEKLEAELKTCHATIDGKNDLILACDKLLAEQKETIETLQSSVKSMDLEYKKLAAEYNALS